MKYTSLIILKYQYFDHVHIARFNLLELMKNTNTKFSFPQT